MVVKGGEHMAAYSQGKQQKMERVMHEFTEGKLRSGRSKKRVTSRKQAIAIGLSEARKKERAFSHDS